MVTPLPNKREKGSLACMEADGKVSSGLLYKAMIKSKIHVSSFSLVKEMKKIRFYRQEVQRGESHQIYM